MTRSGLLFVCFCLFLSACAPTNGDMPTLTAIPSATVSPAPTQAATLAPSATSTLVPDTLTPVPPTITPLPTIPTFTPTFDVRKIITATPAPKAECPNENPNAIFAIPTPDSKSLITDYPLAIQNFLAGGGSLQAIYDALKPFESQRNVTKNDPVIRKPTVLLSDLTNDGMPELITSRGLYGSIIYMVVILRIQKITYFTSFQIQQHMLIWRKYKI